MRFAARAIVAGIFLPALALLVPGCSSHRSAPAARTAGKSFNVITLAEIEGRQWPSAYDLIGTLRPQWFTPRGPDSLNGLPAPVQVYLDATRLRGVAALHDIPVAGLARIEFLSGLEASARWGLDHGGGAILLTTQTR